MTAAVFRLLSFACVGAVGFVVDAGVLTFLVKIFGWNVYAARGVSFPAATIVTWALNRRLAFATRQSASKHHEYARYLLVQVMGAGINLACFSVLLVLYPWMNQLPVVPLFFGALVALLFNYAGSRYFVYRGT